MDLKTSSGKAHARAGLLGNPSDGYFGKTISFLVRNFTARVRCVESARLAFTPRRNDRIDFSGIDDLAGQVRAFGYHGGLRLLMASVKRFDDICRQRGAALPRINFTMEYETDIPVRVGLAGSSAIVTAAMRALMEFYSIEIPKPDLANLILSVETGELGIAAGLQDRVIQVYEGAVFMDFSREIMERDGHGRYESIDPALLPPLFVAYHESLAEGTEVTHNDLAARMRTGEPAVAQAMRRWASIAQEGRDLIAAGHGHEIGPLMDENFDLRARLLRIGEGNLRLVDTGRRLGAAVKFAGSGGAVVGMHDGDPERLHRLEKSYTSIGAKMIVPKIKESE